MIQDLLKETWIKISIILASVGFFISLIIVLIKGEGFPEILIRPLVSGIIMALFWIICYFLIKKLVPDFINEMQRAFSKSNEPGSDSLTPSSNASSFENSDDFNFELDSSENGIKMESAADDSDVKISKVSDNSSIKVNEKVSEDIKLGKSPGRQDSSPSKPKQKAGSDEMLVHGVPIKKDPELMARTIQHVLDTDKE